MSKKVWTSACRHDRPRTFSNVPWNVLDSGGASLPTCHTSNENMLSGGIFPMLHLILSTKSHSYLCTRSTLTWWLLQNHKVHPHMQQQCRTRSPLYWWHIPIELVLAMVHPKDAHDTTLSFTVYDVSYLTCASTTRRYSHWRISSAHTLSPADTSNISLTLPTITHIVY